MTLLSLRERRHEGTYWVLQGERKIGMLCEDTSEIDGELIGHNFHPGDEYTQTGPTIGLNITSILREPSGWNEAEAKKALTMIAAGMPQ